MIVFYIIISLIWIVSLFYDISFLGVSTTSNWYTPFTYMFFHTNIIHLASNIFALELLHTHSKKILWKYKPYSNGFVLLCIAILTATIAGYIAQQNKMTIGASAIVYFYIGFILTQYNKDIKYVLSTITLLLLSNIILVLIGNNALLVHFIGLVGGIIYNTYLIYDNRRNCIRK